MRQFSLLLMTYLLLGFMGNAFALSIIPKQTDQSLFYLYKLFTIDSTSKSVKVTGLKVTGIDKKNGRASLDPKGNPQVILLDKFVFFRRFSPAVFEATTGSGTSVGTAFLIAKDLVLTNKHVADTDNHKKSCGKFSVTLNDVEAEEVPCKKVHYCDEFDFCVIELQKTKTQKSVGELVKPLVFINKNSTQVTAQINSIGNARGLGVQGGVGHGIKYNSESQMNHFAPTLGGNSGSPILNNNGLVLGINYAHSGTEYSNEAINYAVPAAYILKRLKSNLSAALFAEIKTASENLISEGDQTFEKNWLMAWNKYANMTIYSDEELQRCITENDLTVCLKNFNQEISDTTKELSYFTKSEQKIILQKANQQILLAEELQKILKMTTSFELRPSQNHCQAYKDLTFDCVKDDFLTLTLFGNKITNQWLSSIGSERSGQVIDAIVEHSQLKDGFYKHEVLMKLETNKELISKIFVNCLAAVKTISSLDEGWLGEYTEIGYDHNCEAVMASTIKAQGFTIKDIKSEEMISAMRFGLITFKFSETFSANVVNQWNFLLNHIFESKENRKNKNLLLIDGWIKDQKLDFKAEDLYLTIQKKMRMI